MLTGPATAWNVHIASHPSVAVDEHHHHGDGADDHELASVPDDSQQQRDGGHDHMPSVSANLIVMPDAAPLLEVPSFRVASIFGELIAKPPPDGPEDRQKRPPKNA